MDERRKLSAAMKFCFLLGKTTAETVIMLQTTYENAALNKTQILEWFASFRNGQLILEDQFHSG